MNLALFISGHIGVQLLFHLLQKRHHIKLIVTKASEHGLFDFLQRQKFPESVKEILVYEESEVLQRFQKHGIDLSVIGCFHILPESVWSFPPKGTINLHYSLLPSYRGPTPLEWQIHFQEKTFGLTIHQLTKQIDKGPILYQQEFKMPPQPTVPALIEFLIPKGNMAMDAVIHDLQAGRIQEIQSNHPSSYYSFFKKEPAPT